MTQPELRDLVLAHLADPLKPTQAPSGHPIYKLVNTPTRGLNRPGGLSPEGLELFKADKEVLAAGQQHAEAARVKIHGVLITCSLFAKQQTNPLNQTEQNTLANGIEIIGPDGKPDVIQTTRKNGKLLTPAFKTMMSELFPVIKRDYPNATDILSRAALLQQKAEIQEQQTRAAASEMA